MTLRHFLRAVRIQLGADLRNGLLGALLYALFIIVCGIGGAVAASHFSASALLENLDGTAADTLEIAATVMVAVSVYNSFSVAFEFFNDHMSGSLLRIRMLPRGLDAFMLGRSLSSLLLNASTLLVALALTFALLRPPLEAATLGRALAVLLLSLLTGAAALPLGFLAGAANRGLISHLVISLGGFGLIALAGLLWPVSEFPPFLVPLALVLPGWWGSQLVHLAAGDAFNYYAPLGFLGADGAGYHPLVCVTVLAIWLIGGFCLARALLRRSLRRSSLGALMRSRTRYATAAGI